MSEPARPSVTLLLEAAGRGDAHARQEVFALLYHELRERAGRLPRDHASDTFGATVIVHEAYLRLCGGGAGARWVDRAHFLATASLAMRHVLIDHVRERNTSKRRPDGARVPLDDLVDEYAERVVDLEAFDRALAQLATFNPEMARAFDLRLFGGAGIDETAEMLGMSRRTFERRWQAARAWIASKLT